MATGALDANGIWQYGEDDSEPTFSGMLNKLASSTSTTVTRLEELSGLTAAQLTTHRDNLGVGLVNVVPSSVAQAGGSASANAQGLVTFTGVTSLSLNDVFSSAYTNYQIVYSGISAASGFQSIFLRMRTTTDSAAGYYYGCLRNYVNGSSASYSGSNQAQMLFGIADTVRRNSGSFSIQNPNVALATSLSGTFNGADSTTQLSASSGGFHDSTTQFTGFTIYPGGSNITGTIQVFGYNN